jgi:fatty acid desaturase
MLRVLIFNAMEPRFEVLRGRVEDKGLYARTYGAYLVYACLVIAGIAASLYVVTLTDSLIVQMVNSIFFSLVVVQGGMLGHDLSHNQVFSSKARNKFFSKIVWALVGGMSETLWRREHNAHHEHVNQEGFDPDLNIPFFFSPTQTHQGRTIAPFITRHQHIIFFVVVPIVYVRKVLRSWMHLPDKEVLAYVGELTLVTIHFAVLGYVLFTSLPYAVWMTFGALHLLTVGLYMGMIFAPNHKGEEVLGPEAEVTWVHQITSTRNLTHSFFTFHFFGGLSLQIEHHLFPNMSRYQYSKAQQVVKEYCAEHGLSYHETSWWGSMKEIYTALKRESARVHTLDA